MDFNIAGNTVSLDELIADVEAAKDKFGYRDFCFTGPTVEALVGRLKKLSTPKKMYYFKACTGCTCCRNENYARGPFESVDAVLSSVEWAHKYKSVCSQYSTNGEYYFYLIDTLPTADGRFIFGDLISPGLEERLENDPYMPGPSLHYVEGMIADDIQKFFEAKA